MINELANWQGVIDRHYFHNDEVLGLSKINVPYLDSIIDLCNNHQVTTVLASLPVHANYLNNIPKPILQQYQQYVQKYAESSLVFDLTTQVYPDSLYMNPDHMNEAGAARFTQELIHYLQQPGH